MPKKHSISWIWLETIGAKFRSSNLRTPGRITTYGRLKGRRFKEGAPQNPIGETSAKSRRALLVKGSTNSIRKLGVGRCKTCGTRCGPRRPSEGRSSPIRRAMKQIPLSWKEPAYSAPCQGLRAYRREGKSQRGIAAIRKTVRRRKTEEGHGASGMRFSQFVFR